MQILEEISAALQQGKAKIVTELVTKALEDGTSAKEILEGGLLAGMSIIGEKFKKNEVYVPEVLIAARAMNAGAALLKSALADEGVESGGTVVLGTVKGDLHDIGKNLVKMMMEGKGLKVVDMGVDVPADKFIETAKSEKAQIIACSALLTTTMSEMKNVVEAANAAGIRNELKIMIGGAPITQEFCKSIGADLYAPDAASAADEAVVACKGA